MIMLWLQHQEVWFTLVDMIGMKQKKLILEMFTHFRWTASEILIPQDPRQMLKSGKGVLSTGVLSYWHALVPMIRSLRSPLPTHVWCVGAAPFIYGLLLRRLIINGMAWCTNCWAHWRLHPRENMKNWQSTHTKTTFLRCMPSFRNTRGSEKQVMSGENPALAFRQQLETDAWIWKWLKLVPTKKTLVQYQ